MKRLVEPPWGPNNSTIGSVEANDSAWKRHRTVMLKQWHLITVDLREDTLCLEGFPGGP